MAIPKARTIPIIIINTNQYNVWVRQPLLAAKLCDAECNEIEYRVTMNREGNNISVGFQPIPPQLIDINSSQVEAGPIQPNSPKCERPEFGPRPDTDSKEFNFKDESDWLPFQLKIRKYFKDESDWLPFQLKIRKESNFTQEQQSHFIGLVYDNKVGLLLT